MKRTITLYNPQQGYADFSALWVYAKSLLTNGHRLVLELRPEKRSDEQNALLHSCFSDIAKQVEWCGKKLSIDVWKRLCTAAWLREEGESPEMVPALDGKGFDVIFERTSRLSVKQVSSLITWVHAFGDEHAVKWSPTSLGRGWAGMDPETGELLERAA